MVDGADVRVARGPDSEWIVEVRDEERTKINCSYLPF